MRILIISLSNLGDALLTYPAIQAVRSAYPDAEYHVLVPPNARPLFEVDPRFHRVWAWRRDGSLLAQVGLALRLARMRFHLVVDFRNSLLPLFLPGAKRTPLLRRYPPRMHRVDQHLALVDSIHIPSRHLPPPCPPLPSGERVGVRGSGRAPLPYGPLEEATVASWVQPGRPVVVMVSGAKSHLKRWAADRFAAVADRLIQDKNAQVILVGAADEQAIAQGVERSMRQPLTNLVGRTSLSELAALLSRAQLMVTNDCACLHAAELMGVPTVAIFGPTDEKKYGPRHPRSRVIRRHLVCAPCERAQCPYGHECMEWVEADEVYAAAAEVLNGKG